MADEAVATQEVAIEELSQEDYKKARAEGKTVVEQPIEKPVEPEKKEEEEPEEPEAAEEKPKVSGGFQKRIQRLTKETATEREGRLRAEYENAELKKKLQELEGKTEKPKADGEPKQADYTDYEEYLVDKAAWKLEQKQLSKKQAEEQKEISEFGQSLMAAHNARIEKAKAEIEDFEEAVNAVEMPWSMDNPSPIETECFRAFYRAVTEDENSEKITYYYAKHPDELAKLGDLTPGQIGKAVGRVADKVAPKEEEVEQEEEEKPKPKPVSKAPTPIRAVGGGSSKTSVPLDQVDDMAEYKKRRRAGEHR